jgi:hypothetical protein
VLQAYQRHNHHHQLLSWTHPHDLMQQSRNRARVAAAKASMEVASRWVKIVLFWSKLMRGHL